MEKITRPLTPQEIKRLKSRYGRYTKLVVDLNREVIVLGCSLHADGAEFLKQQGSRSDDLWGGGIDWLSKQIDTMAVFNLRPRLDNNSMEILAPWRRKKFIHLVKKYLLSSGDEKK